MLDLGVLFVYCSAAGIGVRCSVLRAHHWGCVLQYVLCTMSATSVVLVLFVSDGVA